MKPFSPLPSSLLRLVTVPTTLLCCLIAHGDEKAPAAADPFAPRTYTIPAGEDMQFLLQERLINAVPGDIIQLEEGIFTLHAELNVTCDNLTIRGRGIDKTILSFKGQHVGSEGLVATGDAFVIEDLAVEDSVGNAIKVLGSNGVVFRRVRTEWTNGPDPENGAYGIYPVQCENVLIEDSVAIGASDAGIYVGQSKNVIVRGCRAEQNVAGIEIENTIHADVYENVATGNTGGLLVFDLPGLQLTNGGQVRVFNNRIVANNIDNFAPPGNMVATVPPGTGVMVLATDDVEIFNNTIADNKTYSLTVLNYLITQRAPGDPKYDPFPENIWIHDNLITGGGTAPAGEMTALLKPLLGTPFPDILFDGMVKPTALKDGRLVDSPVRISGNTGHEKRPSTFANFNITLLSPENIVSGKYKLDRDIAAYTGELAAIAPVTLPPLPGLTGNGNPAAAVYRQLPKQLSAWGFFEGNGATQQPAAGVLPYDLNTPLFSDYTTKYRFIRLPAGATMDYRADGVFEFPVGTAIVKTFAYPHDLRDPQQGERLLETRIEERRDSGWFGYTYVWNNEQTDASLTLGGGSLDVQWIHNDGSTRKNSYQIPNANQCISCHGQKEQFQPLGPTAANLNRHFVPGSGHGNQLVSWQTAGQLAAAPTIDDVPRMAAFDDPHSGTLTERARAWLDVNCAHCHNPDGSARTSGLDLRTVQDVPARFGVWKSPVATGRGSGGHKFDIVPGKPDESILVYRLESDQAGIRMPNVARSLTHVESLALIREWIASLPIEAPPQGNN